MSHFPSLITNLPNFLGHFNAFELNTQNCKILFASYTVNQHILVHTHDSDNTGIITKGELILIINGVQSIYKVGEWYNIPKNTLHEAKFLCETCIIEFWFNSK